MTWVLNAAGDCPPENEREFAENLAPLLARYGATASQLTGEASNGPVHVPPAPKAGKAKQG